MTTDIQKVIEGLTPKKYYVVYHVDTGEDCERAAGVFREEDAAKIYAAAFEEQGGRSRVDTIEVWRLPNHLIVSNRYAPL
ncbi:MAG: hypothetical protein NTX00_03075 [Candidatus Parcubacteria bacterium]|nr:hypothetical protein [Candidatus Parcubacteria bacterium]